jgi:hypothetical protein
MTVFVLVVTLFLLNVRLFLYEIHLQILLPFGADKAWRDAPYLVLRGQERLPEYPATLAVLKCYGQLEYPLLAAQRSLQDEGKIKAKYY